MVYSYFWKCHEAFPLVSFAKFVVFCDFDFFNFEVVVYFFLYTNFHCEIYAFPKLEGSQPPDPPQDQSPVLEEHGVLLSNFQTQASSMAQATDVLQGFASKSVKTSKVTKFSHLFISPPKTDLSTLFKPNDVSKFFNQAAFKSSVPMSSQHTIQSKCPSYFSNNLQFSLKSITTDERPPKRSKMEKNTGKTCDDIHKLFENQIQIMNHLSYYTLHNQVHRNWQTSALSIRLNLPPPADIPF